MKHSFGLEGMALRKFLTSLTSSTRCLYLVDHNEFLTKQHDFVFSIQPYQETMEWRWRPWCLLFHSARATPRQEDLIHKSHPHSDRRRTSTACNNRVARVGGFGFLPVDSAPIDPQRARGPQGWPRRNRRHCQGETHRKGIFQLAQTEPLPKDRLLRECRTRRPSETPRCRFVDASRDVISR